MTFLKEKQKMRKMRKRRDEQSKSHCFRCQIDTDTYKKIRCVECHKSKYSNPGRTHNHMCHCKKCKREPKNKKIGSR